MVVRAWANLFRQRPGTVEREPARVSVVISPHRPSSPPPLISLGPAVDKSQRRKSSRSLHEVLDSGRRPVDHRQRRHSARARRPPLPPDSKRHAFAARSPHPQSSCLPAVRNSYIYSVFNFHDYYNDHIIPFQSFYTRRADS